MAADTGPIGGNLSHEFVIIAETGESKVYTDKRILSLDFQDIKPEQKSLSNLRLNFDQYYAVTDEKFNQEEFDKKVKNENKLETKGIEVGHIFYLEINTQNLWMHLWIIMEKKVMQKWVHMALEFQD